MSAPPTVDAPERFDGAFTRQEPLPEEAIERAVALMRSGRLHRYDPPDGGGPSETSLLEREFADYQGQRHCLACASGGAAMRIALAALEVAPGDPAGYKPADALLLFNPGLIAAPYTLPAGAEADENTPRSAGPDGWMTGLLPGGADAGLSPVHFVSESHPPTLIVHGTEDAVVPAEKVKIYAAAARHAGGRCGVVLYEGAGHGFFNRGRDPAAFADTLRRAEAFLEDLGWVDGPPTYPAAEGMPGVEVFGEVGGGE